MQRSRRAVLAAVPVTLAGCGRSFRDNPVPGGLYIRNGRDGPVTVSARAALLPPLSGGGDGAGFTESPTETPETPRDRDLDDPDVAGEYRVQPEEERAVPDFFTEPGRWGFEAVVDDEGDRTRIQLHAALPGPAGADSVVVRITPDDVSVRATTVD